MKTLAGTGTLKKYAGKHFQELRYVGVSTGDLIEIYILFIRSITEYCTVAFHSSLTVAQATDIERILKTSLQVILGDAYVDYPAALGISGLRTLHNRCDKRCLDYALKLLKQSDVPHK